MFTSIDYRVGIAAVAISQLYHKLVVAIVEALYVSKLRLWYSVLHLLWTT